MKIVCASSVLYGAEAFSTLGETVIVPEQAISPEVLTDADALIVRSKTALSASLLDDSPVAFVGTATAGIDHLDLDYLNRRGIAWAAAEGCNANSVSEYAVAALLHTVRRLGYLLEDLTIGVIGVGQVGRRVCDKCSALGMNVLRNDPPRAMRENDPDLIPLESLLPEADIVTFHVPLAEDGPFRTRHLVDHRFLERLKPGALVMNTSRGEVLDTNSLLMALETGGVRAAVLDVWEDEPAISLAALNDVELGTPHIAGHSFEGKLNGTVIVYERACGFFEQAACFRPEHHTPPVNDQVLDLDARGCLDQDVLWEAVRHAYDITADDRQLREGMVDDTSVRGAYFNGLRRNYPIRREFPCTRIRLHHGNDLLAGKIVGLGFTLVP